MIKPLNGMAVVRQELTDEKTKGGIYFANVRASFMGEVLAVAKEIDSFSVGDRVCVKTQSAQSIEVDGEDCWLVSENEVFGKDTGYKIIDMVGDHILIKQVDSTMTPGGLYLSQTKNIEQAIDIDSSSFGVVFSISDGFKDEDGNIVKPCVNIGDWVCMDSPVGSGFEITTNNEKFSVMRDNNIIFKQEIVNE